MLYKLTNVSDGLIVCDLAQKGATLRLNNRQSKTIKDKEITPHIKNLMSKGLILSEEIAETHSKKSAVHKNSNKEKEE